MSTPIQFKKSGLHLSQTSHVVQKAVDELQLDTDGDGKIDHKELEHLIQKLLDSKKDIKSLRGVVTVLVIFAFLLTGCVFGASITAARLATETSIDPGTGIMYVKGLATPIQTEPLTIRQREVKINKMLPVELDVLEEISLDQGLIKFQVTGYAQSLDKKQVTLIMVDGGLLVYGDEGLVSATGMAETILNSVYLPEEEEEAATVSVNNTTGGRHLNDEVKELNDEVKELSEEEIRKEELSEEEIRKEEIREEVRLKEEIRQQKEDLLLKEIREVSTDTKGKPVKGVWGIA